MDKKIEILVIMNAFIDMEERHQQLIQQTFPKVSLQIVDEHEVTLSMIQKAEIIFGWPSAEHLQKAECLKWLHLPSAGVDGYAHRELYAHKDICLTNSSGVFGMPIAEHVFSMILAYNRNLQAYTKNKTAKKWNRIEETRDFFGSTIGIIGLGDIGTEVAKRAKAWGAKVLAVKRSISYKPEYVDQMYGLEEIDRVLEQSDYVVLALPHTPKTEGIITGARLRIMKSTAFLVNIGRGALIDQDALVQALRENWIGGAGLDVTTPEPLPEESPLWELPNVILTLHTSGNSPSNFERKFEIFINNLKAYCENQSLENVVNFEEGY